MNNNFDKKNCSTIESLRSLLESTKWGDVVLHNLPFKKYEQKTSSFKVDFSYSSLYELQKSAVFWSLPDFKVQLNRYRLKHKAIQ